MLTNLYVRPYVLQNSYERLYVLPNSHVHSYVCSSVLQNLYVHSYVLPNSYWRLDVLLYFYIKKIIKKIFYTTLSYTTDTTPRDLGTAELAGLWPLASHHYPISPELCLPLAATIACGH